MLCFQPLVCRGLPLFLPNHPSQRAKCSRESSFLTLLLLVLVFPEKAVFSLGFNPINFYPWEDVSCLLLLFGLPLDIAGHSWRACVGPTNEPSHYPICQCIWQKPSLSSQFPGEWKRTNGSYFLLGCGVFLPLWPAGVKGKLSHRVVLSAL